MERKTRMFTVMIDRVRWTNGEDATILVGHDEAAPFVPITVKMQAVGRAGQRWVVRGRDVTHPTYGDQFDAQFAVPALPRTDGELLQYLIDLDWSWNVAEQALRQLEQVAL